MSSWLSWACSGDMYSGVPTIAPKPVIRLASVSCWPVALATPKSITFGTGAVVVEGDQHVGRLDVAVDDALLVGVLNRLADRDEQLQPLPRGELALITESGDRHALDQLHHEEGSAGFGRSRVQDLGDVGMIHQGQRLPLGLEAGQDLAGSPCPA